LGRGNYLSLPTCLGTKEYGASSSPSGGVEEVVGSFLSLLRHGGYGYAGEVAIDAVVGAMEEVAALLSSLVGSARRQRNWALSPAPFPSTAAPNLTDGEAATRSAVI
jgi:hypothetical protein